MEKNTVSIWNKTAEKAFYPRLTESLDADVLIIGGGITGVTCAYCLGKRGRSSVLIEAGGLCDGTTGNTTGKVTAQHGAVYAGLAKKHGPGAARDYARSQTEGLELVRRAAADEGIDCQLADSPACVFAAEEGDVEAVEKEYEAERRAGLDVELVENPWFPVKNLRMARCRDQYVFHPVRYVEGLAAAAAGRGARICCGTKAFKVEDGQMITVRCEDGIVVRAKHLVMATGYPIYDGPNLFYSKLYPKRTYGIAVRTVHPWPDGSYITAGKPTRSFRTHVEKGEPVLIVVGDGHTTGRSKEDMSVHFENLMQFAEKLAGVREVLAMWSAQDYESPDLLPYIGRISDNTNIYVASGFRKWGLTNGTLAGDLIAELIDTGNCRYEGLYSRTRSDFFSSPGTAIAGNVSSIAELVWSKLEGSGHLERLEAGQGRVVRFGGQRAGIYRGENDDVTILDITCTHMGTELNFNSAEKTWDCPAHGGRFSTDGKLLEGPPKDPLKVLFKGKYEDLFSKNDG
jgi:glycine/D-amino acid oxidase-like deaminating enzyme/nitrite reductase/ring-hydroxylating ferredoxin subunit